MGDPFSCPVQVKKMAVGRKGLILEVGVCHWPWDNASLPFALGDLFFHEHNPPLLN